MGWFDEQLRQRKMNDRRDLEETLRGLADSVLGTKTAGRSGWEQESATALGEILDYYRIRPQSRGTLTEDGGDLGAALESYGIQYRDVELEKGWRKEAMGPMLARREKDGRPVALLPHPLGGYGFYDGDTGQKQRVTRKNEGNFRRDAVAFYRPFPMKKLKTRDLLRYMAGTLSWMDLLLFAGASLAASVVGMVMPKLNNIVFSQVINSGSVQLLGAITFFLVGVSISILFLNAIKALLEARISTKMTLPVQSATMMRLLSLPTGFFKDYSAGELANRARQMDELCGLLVSSVLSAGLTALFSLVYIQQIFNYTPVLVTPSLWILLSTLAVTVISVLWQTRLQQRQAEAAAKEQGLGYALISGVQKLKLSGAEQRAFTKWGRIYAQESALTYNPPFFLKMNRVITQAIPLFGAVVLYYRAVRGGVTVAEYYAFATAYSMVSGAFGALAGTAFSLGRLRPILHMVKPIMETVPENAGGGQDAAKVRGKIELTGVTFRYNDQMPPVIDDLSLKINPGEYVAIVGATGCGKSTLMRLLLGFERPQRGSVYYDGQDLASLNLRSLRRKIGVVMQNGKLFSGDIFSNITISAPWLTMDDAWEAAELAGIADDIRRMPMGMSTYISEGSGGVSGGQRQRLMIARAVAPKPKILMLDEATSALDNLTQKKVAQSLDSLSCTRIVIAHRLSTIRQCDRILYLEKGKIREEGSYEELIAKNGKFARLVERQRIQEEPN